MYLGWLYIRLEGFGKMRPMTPAEVEAIKKTIEIAAKDPAWCKAIASVIDSQAYVTIAQAANSVAMSVETFIGQFCVALSEPSKILRPILQNAHLTEGKATQYLFDAQKLVNSGVPEALRAGGAAGAGGAGAAATGAAAGKGAIILKGLAILGGLIVFAVVSYYVAGAIGEWSADDPIGRTGKGDPETRAAWKAEQAASVARYGDMIVTINGVDVTDKSLGELRYLYHTSGTHTSKEYVLRKTDVITVSCGSLFSSSTDPDCPIVNEPDPRFSTRDPVTGKWDYTFTNLSKMVKEVSAIGGPYYTYGEVCNAIAKRENYEEGIRGSYTYGNSIVYCDRERL